MADSVAQRGTHGGESSRDVLHRLVKIFEDLFFRALEVLFELHFKFDGGNGDDVVAIFGTADAEGDGFHLGDLAN